VAIKLMEKFDFSAILAASVHDMKNSLGGIRTSLSHLAAACDESHRRDFANLDQQTERMNDCLLHLLILYKIDLHRLAPDIDAHAASDILEEVLARQTGIPELKQLDVHVECAGELCCYCDQRLLCTALAGVLHNARRYANDRILLSAAKQDDFVSFSVEDDGPGFTPAQLKASPDSEWDKAPHSDNTALGTFFVARIAAMHRHKGKTGHISFDNDSRLGGARFTLFLP